MKEKRGKMVIRAGLILLSLILCSTITLGLNVIITADELADKAKVFADFRGSDVVNLSFIDSNYEEAENNGYVGYNNQNIEGSESIVGYDYSLAKKIISFLRENDYDMITLFGDAKLVPPSYYFYNDIGVNVYDKWIPTDFFYASADYDLDMEGVVGRIPVMDENEADNYLDKVMNWVENDKAVVAGGKITESVFYEGELAAVDSLNKGFFGDDVEKFFESDGNFESDKVEEYFSGGAGVLYIVGHGDGDSMIFEDGEINSRDIMTDIASYDVPFVVSVLCNNGAFDTRLTGQIYSKSFGESIVASKAGGVAYLGASRFSYGVPEYDDGGIKKSYMTELIDDILDETGSLGERVKKGVKKYVESNNMIDKYNLRTVFELVLLGDPAISLKERGSSVSVPELDVEDINGIVNVTSSEAVDFKLIKDDEVVSSGKGDSFGFSYSDGVYLLKADNGKEKRLYFGLEDEEVETVIVKKVYVEDEGDRKKHDVAIIDSELSNGFLKCDRKTKLDIKIRNDGRSTENVVLDVKSEELDIESSKEIKIRESDEYEVSYALDFPEAEAGEYSINIRLYDDYEVFDNEYVSLVVEDCVVKNDDSVEENMVVIPPKPKVAEKDWLWNAVGIVLIAGVTMFLIMFSVMKLGKTKSFK